MLRNLVDRLTYANVMATVAVFIAIGGGAYAAGLAKDSVGTKQIKDSAVTTKKISASAQDALKSGPAGGDLNGSYPNPTLRAPESVGIAQQPPPPAQAIDCITTFDTFCGDANTGIYWNQPTDDVSYLGYFIEPSGFIQFQGAAKRIGGMTTLMFRLPPGHRPAGYLTFTVPGIAVPGNDVSDAILRVSPDGFVNIFKTVGGGTYDLSSVRFRIAN